MEVQVKLKNIIEGLVFLTDEGSSYLNTVTGEVVYVTTEELRAAEEDAPLEDFPAWQHDAIRIAWEILETDYYLSGNHSGPKKLQNRVHAVYAPSHEFSPAH